MRLDRIVKRYEFHLKNFGVERLRLIKSEAEIEMVRRAAQMAMKCSLASPWI